MILSVIIPIYNSSKYLYKCLTSLASIELSDIEFIIVDDGSNDDSCDICKQFCDSDERFSYYYKCNGGVSSARNYGLNISKGKYILFLDSDDYINCNILSAISRCEKYNIKFLVLRRYYITRDCDEFEYNLYDKKIFEQQDQSLYKVLDVPLLFNKKIVIAGGGYVPVLEKVKLDNSFIVINRWLQNAEIATLVRHCHVIVCPYLSSSQTGITQTAFCFDKPIVASRVPAFVSTIENEKTGLLVDVGDETKFAAAINRTYVDSCLYNNMCKNIRIIRKNSDNSWRKIVNMYVDEYLK